ncbi:MerR family transcriptional regulator [Streptomyces sp. NPDC050528]|uniref:MerR family transcriptional regulator n=1 Tax=Streptomyces sp. NPDC050528 TaxID=3365623 RepID=UPI00378F0095
MVPASVYSTARTWHQARWPLCPDTVAAKHLSVSRRRCRGFGAWTVTRAARPDDARLTYAVGWRDGGLRHYEEQRLLLSARTAGGQRDYPDEALERVQLIQDFQD